jgi:integral membrane sensor domain MASE1
VSAFFLRKERGARLDNAFLIGGLLASAVVGIVVLALIRLAGLQLPKNTTPRAGIGGAIVVGLLVFAPTVQYLGGL